MSHRLAIFDLDHTLLNCNSSFRFGLYLFRRGIFKPIPLFKNLINYARYKFFHLPIAELHHLSFNSLFKGRSALSVNSLVEDFLNLYLDSMLYAPAREKMNEKKKEGVPLLLLSSSPDFLVNAIAKKLGIENVSGTPYLVDDSGHFASIGAVMEGDEKVKFAKHFLEKIGLSQDNLEVYTDSILDLPLVMIAKEVCLVNPDAQLKQLARQYGWKILGNE